MGKFGDYLVELNEKNNAFLIDDNNQSSRTKEDYIIESEVGTIVAFRLNFKSKREVPLTKVISGKIIENNKDDELFIVETRNGLKYGVPYKTVLWVKTGNRWPKGIYEEMKKGSVEIQQDSEKGIPAENVDLEDESFDFEDEELMSEEELEDDEDFEDEEEEDEEYEYEDDDEEEEDLEEDEEDEDE